MRKSKFNDYISSTAIIFAGIFLLGWFSQAYDLKAVGVLYPCIFIVAWLYGTGPMIWTLIISVVASDFVIFPPYFSFKFLTASENMRIIIFVVTSLLTSMGLIISNENKAKKLSIENRFKRSADAVNLGIWYCDLPFDVLIWDKRVKEHFWLPENATVTIETFYERIHPEDREKTRKAIEYSIAHQAPYDIIYRTTRPGDESAVKYIRAVGWTDYNSAGQPIRFDGLTFDNTNVTKVTEDLEQSLEVVNTINKVGVSISAELDQEKLVQEVTDAAVALSKAQFGAFFYNLINESGESYTLYTISGVPIEKFSSFPMPRNTEVFAPTFAGTSIIRSDNIMKDPRYGKNAPYFGKPKGHLPVVSYLAVPVISRSGEVIGGIFLGHEKEAVFSAREEKIVAGLASQIAISMDNARLFEKARDAIRLRDEFLGISSHELKTPLTSLSMQLQMFSKLTERGLDTPANVEKAKKIAEVSTRQIKRLNALVDDLLDVSRIANGKLTLNYEDIDVSEVLDEVVERYRPLFSDSNTELIVDRISTLSAGLDRLRFEQVIVNLLSNTLKYAKGSSVEVTLTKNHHDLIFKVSDSGPGIAKKDQDKIFDRFERLNADNVSGLGLGLFIVQQIIVAHGGKIELLSDAGKGATFVVTLPLKPIVS